MRILPIALLSCATLAASVERPNVIVMLTDDQAWDDLSCHGHPILKTPNIDRLHDQSLRFTDFHVAPMCTPTRSQLMTGQDALRNRASCVPAGRNLMRRDLPTMAQVFRDGGYQTGLFGKWHLGDTWPDRPMDRGFARTVWFRGWGLQSEIEFDNDNLNTRWLDQLTSRQDGRSCSAIWFDEAMRWMQACHERKEPFFCYLPTNAPHGPHWVDDRYAAAYQGQVKPALAAYYGMVAEIDEQVGRLDRWLDATGLTRDTLVVYAHDNGGASGQRSGPAGLRGGKGLYYEGGHRVPCFLRWPGGGFAGPRDIDQPTQIQDLLPTFIELCGLTVPAGARFDGASLAPLLRDAAATLPDRKLVVQYGGRTGAKKGEGCVIWNRWRLVGGDELYDVAADRSQARNIAGEQPAVVEAMRAHYEAWWSGLADGLDRYIPIPVDAPDGAPVLLTCNNWAGVDVDNGGRVRAGLGGPRGGPWHLQVDRAGRFTIELRRWPFHIGVPADAEAPAATINGRPLAKSRALPIAGARLGIDDGEATAVAMPPGTLGAVVEVDLPAGPVRLQGWFTDATGKDLCGAYYARIHRR